MNNSYYVMFSCVQTLTFRHCPSPPGKANSNSQQSKIGYFCVSGDEVPGPTQAERHEKSVCVRLGSLVTVFHELTQSAIPIGPCVDSILKQVTRLYKAMSAFTKFVSLCLCHTPDLINSIESSDNLRRQ